MCQVAEKVLKGDRKIYLVGFLVGLCHKYLSHRFCHEYLPQRFFYKYLSQNFVNQIRSQYPVTEYA